VSFIELFFLLKGNERKIPPMIYQCIVKHRRWPTFVCVCVIEFIKDRNWWPNRWWSFFFRTAVTIRRPLTKRNVEKKSRKGKGRPENWRVMEWVKKKKKFYAGGVHLTSRKRQHSFVFVKGKKKEPPPPPCSFNDDRRSATMFFFVCIFLFDF